MGANSALWPLGNQHRGQHLARFERGLEIVHEEPVDGRRAHPFGARDFDVRAGRNQRPGQVCLGIGMAERPADGPPVANGGMCDLPRRVLHDCPGAHKALLVGKARVGNHGPDAQHAFSTVDFVKAGNAAQTHQGGWFYQVGVHHRHQRLASGQAAGVFVAGEHRHGFGNAFRFQVDHTGVSAMRSRTARANCLPRSSAFFFITPAPNRPSRPAMEISEA